MRAYQVLHEFTLLYTDKHELYAVVCLFGEEFALNYGGPEIDGYATWQSQSAVSYRTIARA
jgi:hypothetical protein